MNDDQVLPAIESAEELIASFETERAASFEGLRRDAPRLFEVVRRVEASWSGSFAGWHGSMYYERFQKPPIERRFNGEWGGIHGIPSGWSERTPEDVAAEIDRLMGGGFSVDGFDRHIKEIVAAEKDLAQDVGARLERPLHRLQGSASRAFEKLGVSELESVRERYINGNMPKTLMSRDSEAIRQGVMLPAWLYYMAVAVEAQKALEWLSNFKKSFRRLVEAMPIDLPSNAPPLYGLHPRIVEKCASLFRAGSYPEAAEKGFKVVRDRLRQLTGFETGSDAFGKGRLFVAGAAAPNVDADFNQAIKFLTMAIDMFRNEKAHTSDANLVEPVRAYQYLSLSSLAMTLLEQAEVRPAPGAREIIIAERVSI